MIEVIETTVVHRLDRGSDRQAVVGPRLARIGDRELICTFMLQRKLGCNDFMPVISRSSDLGRTWSAPRPMWPDHADHHAIFGSISPRPDAKGRLLFYGPRFKVDTPGEPIWCKENMGLKHGELFYAVSEDAGHTWSAPTTIPKPTAGSIEAPGAMCITRDGRWVVCYSVYNAFDPPVRAPQEQWWSLRSDDEGRSWQSAVMATFGPQDGTAESWVVELADGRLLGACWHTSHRDGSDYPNPYVLSSDGGVTWTAPQTLGVRGQSLALAALPDGRALMTYNQRRSDPAGVYLAVLEPRPDRMRVTHDALIWGAESRRQHAEGDDGLGNWEDFAFGEPSVLPLDNGEALAVLWCLQPALCGVAGVRVRLP